MRVLVLGGKGFIGRHAVRALRRAGATVTVGTRRPGSAPEQPEKRLVLHERLRPEDWDAVVQQFDTVLNCVGILRQRWGETYADVHNHGPAAIASACASHRRRFVHVSALGLSAQARSRFLTSKWHGEQAIERAGGDWAIARLSLLDGEGGYGASWLRAVAQLPLFIVPDSARGKIAALTADDAGEALARLCMASPQDPAFGDSRFFELGGVTALDFEQYIRALRQRYTQQPARCVRVPGWFARLGAHLCDVVHFSPFSFGHWELLCRDNVPQPNRLPELLERTPDDVV